MSACPCCGTGFTREDRRNGYHGIFAVAEPLTGRLVLAVSNRGVLATTTDISVAWAMADAALTGAAA